MLLPITARTNSTGHLEIGGCDTVDLARQFGTPLYIFDEQTLRGQCQDHVRSLAARYSDSQVNYACKAFTNTALVRLCDQEGLGLDVVSGGELYVAYKAGFPLSKVYFHGNNKSADELALALALGVGRIVVDSFLELGMLNDLAMRAGKRQPVLLRLCPGVDPHTHAGVSTGIADSKFGFAVATGQAGEAMRQAVALPGLEVVGIHAHIGSSMFQLHPYVQATEIMLGFAAEMQAQYGFVLKEFSPGGGWGIAYTAQDAPPTLEEVAETLTGAIKEGIRRLGLPTPKLVVEPGRAIVGPAAVALYTVGSSKEIPGVRKYVSVDGGMADNIRPALYGSVYTALLANRMSALPQEKVTIAGKFCESDDVLIWDITLPTLVPGDLLALPSAGAYCLAMASNYNHAPLVAVVMVRDGQAGLMRRRETYDDLIRLDA
jgi:diaminopimelate decarboxylase